MYVYYCSLLDKHKVEVEDPHRKGDVGNRWVKDFLTDYAESFPQVSSRPMWTGASMAKRGLRAAPFRRCGKCMPSTNPKRTALRNSVMSRGKGYRRHIVL